MGVCVEPKNCGTVGQKAPVRDTGCASLCVLASFIDDSLQGPEFAKANPGDDPTIPIIPEVWDNRPRVNARWQALADIAQFGYKNDSLVQFKVAYNNLRTALNSHGMKMLAHELSGRYLKGAIGAGTAAVGVGVNFASVNAHAYGMKDMEKVHNGDLKTKATEAQAKYEAALRFENNANGVVLQPDAVLDQATIDSIRQNMSDANVNKKAYLEGMRNKAEEAKSEYRHAENMVVEKYKNIESYARAGTELVKVLGELANAMAENSVVEAQRIGSIINENSSRAGQTEGELTQEIRNWISELAQALKDFHR